MKESEAYSIFLDNLCGKYGEADVMLNNSLVNQCVRAGFNSGMSEVETLRAVVLSMIKVSDEHLELKLKQIMTSSAPRFYAGGK